MKSTNKGFSIVELIVVIVIIAILATLIIVGYGSFSGDATKTSIQNDLSNATEQLEVFNYQNKKYPATINCAVANSTTNLCIRVGATSTFEYSVDSTANPQGYCFSTAIGSVKYYILDKSTRNIMPGGCVIQNGLVLNLDPQNPSSYPGSGSTWTDLSSSSKNATLFGSPTYNSSLPSSLYFSEPCCKYARVTGLETTNYPTNSTISLWLKLANNATDYQGILDGYRTNNGHIFIRSTGSNANLQIAFQSTTLTSYPYVYTWNSSTKNQWFNLVIVADVANLNGKVYVNAVQLNSGAIVESNWTPSGQILTLMSQTGQLPGTGDLGEVQIYNRVLSASEITQNFNTQRVRYGI